MPTPKAKTNANAKSNEKAKAEAEKLAKLKVVEKCVPSLTKAFQAYREADEAAKSSLLDIFSMAADLKAKHGFDEKQDNALLTKALANVYCEGDESQVSMEGNSTAYTLRSKFARLLNPVNDKAGKEMKKALDKGVDFNSLLKVARGKQTAAQTNKKGSQGGARQKGGNFIENHEEFENHLSALVGRAFDGKNEYGQHEKYKGGLSLEEIEEVCADVVAAYQAIGGDDGDDGDSGIDE